MWIKEKQNYVIYKYNIDEDNTRTALWSHFNKDQAAVTEIYINGEKMDWVYDPIKGLYAYRYYTFPTKGIYTIKLVFDTSKLLDASSLFSTWDDYLIEIDFTHFDMSNATNMKYFLGDNPNIHQLDLSYLDTSNVTDMEYIIGNCPNLTSVTFGGNFDISKVENMYLMFYKCSGLTSLNLSNWNTSNVTDMCCMFEYCISLTSIDLSNFNTSAVTDMSGMFNECSNLTSIDLSSFDTSNVTDMREMFSGCSGLTSLDLSNFNTSNVTRMKSMLKGVDRNIVIGLENLDLSKSGLSSVDELFD